MAEESLLIYFTDGKNPPRQLDISNIELASYSLVPPENLQVTTEVTEEIQSAFFYWDDVAGATGYNLYINGEQYNTEPVTETNYLITEMAEGDYTAVVTALQGDLESNPSNTVSFDIFIPVTPVERIFVMPQRGNTIRVLDYEGNRLHTITLDFSSNASTEALGVTVNKEDFKIFGNSTASARFAVSYDIDTGDSSILYSNDNPFARAGGAVQLNTLYWAHGMAGNGTYGFFQRVGFSPYSRKAINLSAGNVTQSVVAAGPGGAWFALYENAGVATLTKVTLGVEEDWTIEPGLNYSALNDADRNELAIAACRGGGVIVGSNADTTIKKFDNEGNEVWSLDTGRSDVSSICIDYNDDFFVVFEGRILRKYSRGSAIAPPEMEWEYDYPTLSTGSMRAVAFDGIETLVTVGTSGRVLIHDATAEGALKASATESGHTNNVNRVVALHPGNLAIAKDPPTVYISITEEGDTSLTLEWEEPASNVSIDGYNLYYEASGAPVRVNSSLITGTSYAVSGLSPGVYEFYVKSVVGGIEGTEGNRVSKTVFIVVENTVTSSTAAFVNDPIEQENSVTSSIQENVHTDPIEQENSPTDSVDTEKT